MVTNGPGAVLGMSVAGLGDALKLPHIMQLGTSGMQLRTSGNDGTPERSPKWCRGPSSRTCALCF